LTVLLPTTENKEEQLEHKTQGIETDSVVDSQQATKTTK
jgi:hypothetical protein